MGKLLTLMFEGFRLCRFVGLRSMSQRPVAARVPVTVRPGGHSEPERVVVVVVVRTSE